MPEYSIRTALRTLVRRKVLKESREGREKYYSSSKGASATTAAPAAPRPRSAPMAAPSPVEAVAVATTGSVEVPVGETPGHKLAVGEVLILAVGEQHVETATNVHGKLVLEHHRRSRRPSA